MSRKATYPDRFLGQHLEAAVARRQAEGVNASEAEVARAMGVDPSTFNRWINGMTHPRTEEDWMRLTNLGYAREFLQRLELLDKLDAWRRDLELTRADLLELATQLETQSRGKSIFRTEEAVPAAG